jgi:diacylglycerol kinase family enzyme
VVVNAARVSDPEQLRRRVTARLQAAGWPAPQWYSTTAEETGGEQTRTALAAGAEVVFVAGGDGTIATCAGALVGTDATLAVLPLGTGNLVARNLGLPTDPDTVVDLVVAGDRRRIDVGLVDGRVFLVMAGIGFDAELLEGTSEAAKRTIGWFAYLLAGLRLLRAAPVRMTVEVAGGPVLRRRARSVLVANMGVLEGGIPLFPGAAPDDGQLDIGILSPRTARHWARLLFALLVRRNPPYLEVVRGSRAVVHAESPQSRELDGEVLEPGAWLEAEVRGAALWVSGPQG